MMNVACRRRVRWPAGCPEFSIPATGGAPAPHLSSLLIPDISVIYCRSSKKQFSGQDFPQHRGNVQSQTPSGRLSSWYSYSLLVDVSLCHLLNDRKKSSFFFNSRIDFLKNNCILPSSDICKYTLCAVRFSCWSDRWKKGFSNS